MNAFATVIENMGMLSVPQITSNIIDKARHIAKEMAEDHNES